MNRHGTRIIDSRRFVTCGYTAEFLDLALLCQNKTGRKQIHPPQTTSDRPNQRIKEFRLFGEPCRCRLSVGRARPVPSSASAHVAVLLVGAVPSVVFQSQLAASRSVGLFMLQ